MKKLFVLLLSVMVLPLASSAQSLPKTVQEVRKMYADAHQAIADMDLEEHMLCRMVSTSQCNMPAVGIPKETITTYFNNADRDEDWYPIFRPFFITRKFNASVRQFYEEYLFDMKSGRLVFAFLQGDSYEHETKDETRYYFGEDGLISENIKGDRIAEADAVVRYAESLRAASVALMAEH